MKKISLICFCYLIICSISILNFPTRIINAAPLSSKIYHILATGSFYQDWSDGNLIVNNHDWSTVPSIEGFSGVFLTNNDETDPQSILAPDNQGQFSVFANQHSPSTFHNSGVTEFDYFLYESIALSGSGMANAPYIKIYINTTACSDIQVKYNVIDLDGSEDNTQQQVALHYRINASGNFINLPEAYIEDATEGPNKSGKVTPIDIKLPSEASNQSMLELRIMTADALGKDEWVGIDDIEISGTCIDPYAEPIIPDCPVKIITYQGQSTIASFSAFDDDGIVNHAVILGDTSHGIHIGNIQPANKKGETLTGELLMANDSPFGEHEIQIKFSNNDPTPQSATCFITVNIIPSTCSQPDTHRIGEIQGDGNSSPFDSQMNIRTSGVVTATFFEGGINGFFLQDPIGDDNGLTSDAIFVSYVADSIQVGQQLQVTGSVNEHFSRTQLENINHVEICGIPENISPIKLYLPIKNWADFEKYENMLVTFPQGLIINDYYNFDRYGELTLGSKRHFNPTSLVFPGSEDYEYIKITNSLDRIILDDGKISSYPNPIIHPNGDLVTANNLFRGGDKLTNIMGILDYAYGSYRIQPIKPAEYTNINTRPLIPSEVNGDIKVASFNVMNYFTSLKSRGAANEFELTRQREKLISTIISLDADILGLVEIENDNNTLQDLVTHLNMVIGKEGFSHIDTGIIGKDEIKVGLVYKLSSVIPIGDFAILDTSIDHRFNDDKNRPTLAQTFSDTKNNRNFTVVVNHLKSKGSACDDLGDFDLQNGSGNCNLTRLAAAKALVDWIASDPTKSNSHDYLIIGDLNSYTLEDPIQAILSGADDEYSTFDDYANLIHQFIGEQAYTYVYNGEFGYLDHALASTFLTQRATGVTIWHTNADEPKFLDYRYEDEYPDIYEPNQFRSSDHDPILIGFDFSKDIAPIALSKDIDPSMQNQEIHIRLKAIDEYNRHLDFRIVEDPEYGTLKLSDDLVIYTPKTNFSGSDSFSYVANNGIQDSNIALIQLNIQTVNQPPSANPDLFEIGKNLELSVAAPGVLENDSDPENDQLHAFLITMPENGTLHLKADGSFTYRPELDFIGEVIFTYKAFDGKEYSMETIVKIKILSETTSLENKVYLPIILRNH